MAYFTSLQLTSGVSLVHDNVIRDMLYSLKNLAVLLLQINKRFTQFFVYNGNFLYFLHSIPILPSKVAFRSTA